jgi:hypothetical protein
MAGFFKNDPSALAEHVSNGFKAIQTNASEQLAAIDRIFGSSELFVPFYVTPKAQNLNPADQEEDESGLITRNNIFELLDDYLARPHFSHTFILSDAGMGKTSLLVILKLAHIYKLVNADVHVSLLKLGSNSAADIRALTNPAETLLLLDALDEDPEAWNARFYDRMQQLLQLTKHFRKVLITCRSQFCLTSMSTIQ